MAKQYINKKYVATVESSSFCPSTHPSIHFLMDGWMDGCPGYTVGPPPRGTCSEYLTIPSGSSQWGGAAVPVRPLSNDRASISEPILQIKLAFLVYARLLKKYISKIFL